jgi:hypothetical protein
MPSCDSYDPDRRHWGAVVHAPRETVDLRGHPGNVFVMVEENR